jgi:hypothetical protein
MGVVSSTQLNDTICVLAGMGGDWSINVELHLVLSQAWDGFGQQMLKCIWCPRWHGIGLVNKS